MIRLLWRHYRPGLAAGAIAFVVISAGGCGGQEKATSAPRAAKTESAKAENPYVELLLGFRDAARSNATYDVYGYAEYVPDPQRAAIVGFCLVTTEARAPSESSRLSDPTYLAGQIVAAAETDPRNASRASIRRATHELLLVIEPESLDGALVKSYAKACY